MFPSNILVSIEREKEKETNFQLLLFCVCDSCWETHARHPRLFFSLISRGFLLYFGYALESVWFFSGTCLFLPSIPLRSIHSFSLSLSFVKYIHEGRRKKSAAPSGSLTAPFLRRRRRRRRSAPVAANTQKITLPTGVNLPAAWAPKPVARRTRSLAVLSSRRSSILVTTFLLLPVLLFLSAGYNRNYFASIQQQQQLSFVVLSTFVI